MMSGDQERRGGPSEWMPAAVRDPVDGGQMEGQPWYSMAWHTSESGNDPGVIAGVADWVKRRHSEYHLLWNPWTGELRQLIAASESARALRNASGGYRTNRKGTRLIQVCVIGRASQRPLAGGSPLKGWPALRAWLAAHGIPETDRTGDRTRARWESSGVHRHADAPGNDHTDPGPIDFALLYGSQEEEEMPMIEFVTVGGTVFEVNPYAGTCHAFTSVKKYKARRQYLERAGVRFTDWKAPEGFNRAALGRRMKDV